MPLVACSFAVSVNRHRYWLFVVVACLLATDAHVSADEDAFSIAVAGDSAREKRDYPAAIKLYEQALGMAPTAFGAEHVITGNIANSLAICYAAIGDYKKAEPLYLRALKIREAAQGTNGPFVGDTLNNLGVLYETAGEPAAAKPVFKRPRKSISPITGKTIRVLRPC